MSESETVTPYIGRSETATDRVDPERMARLAALLDRTWTPADPVPPLAHFVLFRPGQRQSQIGPDGHPARAPEGMLPDIQLPRRMWAGSRIMFHRDLVPGQELVRNSILSKAVAKSGASGKLVFCCVVHEISDAASGEVLIGEEQDLVYREAHGEPGLAPRLQVEPEFAPEYARTHALGPVELFRYSALTFNSHRIHYDRDYAREEEGYQGLVVHGPLLATLLFDTLREAAAGRRIAEFSFRAMSPSFAGEALTFGASIEGGEARLSVVSPVGLAVSGKARLA